MGEQGLEAVAQRQAAASMRIEGYDLRDYEASAQVEHVIGQVTRGNGVLPESLKPTRSAKQRRLDPEAVEYLTEAARSALSQPIAESDIRYCEERLLEEGYRKLFRQALSGKLSCAQIAQESFVRTCHRRVFGALWNWAGKYRIRELSIGVDPVLVPGKVAEACEFIRDARKYGWIPDYALGFVFHAQLVTVHPFLDGNGRTTRLLGDCLSLAVAQSVYSWEKVPRRNYIATLSDYSSHQDYTHLIPFAENLLS